MRQTNILFLSHKLGLHVLGEEKGEEERKEEKKKNKRRDKGMDL